MDNPEVLAAYVAGVFALLVAMLSISFAYVNQLKLQRALEAAKQTETIRLRGLASIGVVMRCLGQLSHLLRWNTKLEQRRPAAAEAIIARISGPLEEQRHELLVAYLENQLYVDRTIGNEILSLHDQLEHLTLTVDGMTEKRQQIDAAIDRLYLWSNARFLNLASELR